MSNTGWWYERRPLTEIEVAWHRAMFEQWREEKEDEASETKEERDG